MFLRTKYLTLDAVVGATSYKVYWGTSTGVYGNNQDIGNVTSYSVLALVPQLSANTTYFMACTASDGVDESAFSNEIQVRNHQQIA